MRILLKQKFSTDVAIRNMKEAGVLPAGVLIKTDQETGRRYFNYINRLSTDVEWEEIKDCVEAVSNLVPFYCDLKQEGVYEKDGIKVIVILKRNQISGVTWEEAEIYGEGVSPEQINEVHHLFRQDQIPIKVKWSSGIPYPKD